MKIKFGEQTKTHLRFGGFKKGICLISSAMNNEMRKDE
jgi:hypothetical protein